MEVENLPDEWLSIGRVGIASTELAVVGYDYHLEHVIVQSLRHMVEGVNVFVECCRCTVILSPSNCTVKMSP